MSHVTRHYGSTAANFATFDRQGTRCVACCPFNSRICWRDAKPFLKLTNGSWPPEYTVDEENGVWMFAEPSKLYEPDVPKILASKAVAALRPMSLRAVADISPGLVTDWANSVYKGHMAYIRCTKDA